MAVDSKLTMYYAELALQKSKEINSILGQADALSSIAQVHVYSGQYDKAKKNTIEAHFFYTQLSHQKGIIESLNMLSNIYMYKGAYDSAIIGLKKSLELSEENNYLKGQAVSYSVLVNIA